VSERIERSYSHDNIILCIGEESDIEKKVQWNPQRMSAARKKSEVLIDTVRKVSDVGVRRIQS
jgi:hypothetical protein